MKISNIVSRQSSYELFFDASVQKERISLVRQTSIEDSDTTLASSDPKARPLSVKVTGLTHLVQSAEDDKSLQYGSYEIEVEQGDLLEIDTAKAIYSRRGPNQEIYDQIDKRNEPEYLWFKILKLNGNPVDDRSLYIRENTFFTEDGKVLSGDGVVRSDNYRWRSAPIERYDYPIIQSSHTKPCPAALKGTEATIDKIAEQSGEQVDIKQAIHSFCQTLHTQLGGSFVSILYGSYATGSQKKGSDIDVMFSCDNQTYQTYRKDLQPLLERFVRVLHEKVGARLDDEIPATSKLLISAQEIMEASSGRLFFPQGKGEGSSPKIHTLSFFLDKEVALDGIKKSESGRFGPEFLESKYLKLRLIFNVLTSPNVMSSNSPEAIEQVRQTAKGNLQHLSECLREVRPGIAEGGVEHLLGDGHGHDGEMFLGYKADRKGVVEHLQRLLQSSDGQDTLFLDWG
ncbi:nucleotidyltransferase domain-containing protein [Burkholderia ubonensis]|uniref:nucleotidyltransferase domain-containing protein n=1 Tax=Burkholderia ubonensis TaxID=101571 RepID=UPI0009B4BC32|nr:nucleotidyltransferase domain-containing protein [Burkholderia ubonensis]